MAEFPICSLTWASGSKGNALKTFAIAGSQHAEKRVSQECSAMILEEVLFGTW